MSKQVPIVINDYHVRVFVQISSNH